MTGILVQGSNGEAQHLSHDERKEAIRLTRQTLNENGFEQVVIIAGTGAQSTRETKKLCADAAEAGAAYCLVLTPGVWPGQMTPANILKFHRDVSTNTSSTHHPPSRLIHRSPMRPRSPLWCTTSLWSPQA